MKRVPIRLKLTAWYVAILLASLSLFGIAAFVAMRKGIEKSVDENLEGQANGVAEVMGRVIQQEPAELQDELREHQELREQADFLQVCDQNGRWIYRSRLITHYGVPMPLKASYSAYNVMSADLPLRALVREINAGGQTYRIQVASPMDDFYDAVDQFKWMILLLSPLVLVLASAGGYWLSRRALAPVDQITRASQEINSSNLGKRLEVPRSGDELQRLSETLNRMLGRLESSFNRITQFTADASHERSNADNDGGVSADLPKRRRVSGSAGRSSRRIREDLISGGEAHAVGTGRCWSRDSAAHAGESGRVSPRCVQGRQDISRRKATNIYRRCRTFRAVRRRRFARPAPPFSDSDRQRREVHLIGRICYCRAEAQQ
jgi:HAMP domain-containing protein